MKNNNMKTRVISAIVLIIVVVPLLILGGVPFKLFVSLIGILGIKELIDISKNDRKIPLFMKIISYILMGLFIFFEATGLSNFTFDYRILSILLLIMMLPIVFINDDEKYNIKDALYLIGGLVFLGIGFNNFVLVREISLSHIFYLVLITTMTDTFALFTGMFIGKHKLCEKISPKKTIEGAIGGSLIGTIIPTLFYIYIINSEVNILLLVLITLLLTIVGQVGDLIFSSIKRHFNVKDFSNLIPGHGGILDRFDSLILVVMVYLLFITIL